MGGHPGRGVRVHLTDHSIQVHHTIIMQNRSKILLNSTLFLFLTLCSCAALINNPGFIYDVFRSFHKGDIVSSSRVIVGVDAAIADAASLALMVESVGLGTDQWKDAVKRCVLLVIVE